MHQAGNDGEVVAEVFEQFEVRGEDVILAGFFGEEIGGVQAQRSANADHSAARLGSARCHAAKRKRVEPGECEGYAGSLEKSAAREFHWRVLRITGVSPVFFCRRTGGTPVIQATTYSGRSGSARSRE